MKSALQALEELREGNRRFVKDAHILEDKSLKARRKELTEGQEPFAIVLGCSDSRVPAELVFDQGLGDLFVIRVAGNIAAPSQIGSVEFAATVFGTRLVVVLGHTQCGAVLAAINKLETPRGFRPENLHPIVNRIKPSVQYLLDDSSGLDSDTLTREAVRANVRASVKQLRSGSKTLQHLIQSEGLLVVGAEYALDTGKVEFFDGIPQGS